MTLAEWHPSSTVRSAKPGHILLGISGRKTGCGLAALRPWNGKRRSGFGGSAAKKLACLVETRLVLLRCRYGYQCRKANNFLVIMRAVAGRSLRATSRTSE